MEQNITYRVYAVSELRAWLISNEQNGLSDYCIAPSRAFTLINNPCANDNDPAIVVAFDNDKPIGYSAVFPDEYIPGNTIGRLFWGTTEWIEPEYRGKGIAGKMMRTLKDAVGIERYIGLDSSVASVKLDQKQGANIIYYDRIRYQLQSNHSLKGRILSRYIACHNRKRMRSLNKYDYHNQYVPFVDEQTYSFIEAHAGHDLFLRQREMFDWMLRYPFKLSTHGDSRTIQDICEFGCTKSEFTIDAIKVFVHNQLVGFYIISQSNRESALRYLYYDEAYKNEVFASATHNLLKPGIEIVRFISSELQDFMHRHGIKHMNRTSFTDNIALTLPPNMSVDKNLHVQGGDGDMFC